MLIRTISTGGVSDVSKERAQGLIDLGVAIKESDHIKVELSRLRVSTQDKGEIANVRAQLEAALEHALASEV